MIFKVSGAGGESIDVRNPRMPLGPVYRELFARQRLLFEIGARNRARDFRPPRVGAIPRAHWRQNRLIGPCRASS